MPDSTSYFYPQLTNLISPENLPDILSFIQGGVGNLLGSLYYQNFQVSRSFGGEGAFYSLNIISTQKIEVGLFDTGLYLVLNPDYSNDTVSSFPISIFWNWPILAAFNTFDVTTFSFSPNDVFEITIEILGVTEPQALELAANTFVVNDSGTGSIFQQLIADINTLYGSTIIIDESTSAGQYEELADEIQAIGQEVFPTIFDLFLQDSDISSSLNSIDLFFQSIILEDSVTFLTNLFEPKARVALDLIAALEFPRDYLLPMIQSGTDFVPDSSTDSSGNLKQAYYNASPTQPQVIGVLKVNPNVTQLRKSRQILLVRFTSNINSPSQALRFAADLPTASVKLKQMLRHLLISPNISTVLNGVDITITGDLTPYITSDQGINKLVITPSGGVQDLYTFLYNTLVNATGSGSSYLRYNRIYILQEHGGNLSTNSEGESIFTEEAGETKGANSLIFTLADTVTIAHECLHGLGVQHYFTAFEANNSAYYTFQGLSTDNVMDYPLNIINDPRRSLADWQGPVAQIGAPMPE